MSYAVWHPEIARAHVTVARGIHFANMGHSVARPSQGTDEDITKLTKRLELLPEEALYLVERGSMFCWKDSELTPSPDLEDVEGVPMTVQQAFAEMIGREDLTLEKYQVRTDLIFHTHRLGSCLIVSSGVCVLEAFGIRGHTDQAAFRGISYRSTVRFTQSRTADFPTAVLCFPDIVRGKVPRPTQG